MKLSRQDLRSSLSLGVSCAALLAATGANTAFAQQRVTFSADWQGPVVGMPDSAFSFPITEGDVLRPALGAPAFGPLAVPSITISAGAIPAPGLGLAGHLPCAGHPGGTPCIVEVDALSYGRERMVGPNQPLKSDLLFSVDRLAFGGPSPAWPNVASEAAVGDAAADVFIDLGLGFGPLPPFAAGVVGNLDLIDGDGLMSGSGAWLGGVGLREPSTPAPMLPNPGDNLDALAIHAASTTFPASGVYFSLDAAYVDPWTGIPHTGSALAHGFTCGDVLFSAAPGGPPVVFAPEFLLGLGLTGAEDDLDALILRENGTGVFEPSQFPNDWVGGGTDMLLFSVRRGSAIIGIPDSIMGIPICEGDILTTPLFGSPNPFPGIYIAAENLGLAVGRGTAGVVCDDVDALDILGAPLFDCNGNGVEDAIDISNGTSWDINGNGIPDECELLTRPFCTCAAPAAPAPCGNFYAPGGCQNSTGVGAILSASGTTSVANDNLVLTTTQMPLNRLGLMMASLNTTVGTPFFDGILCLSPQIFRFQAKNSGATGSFSYGPGIVAYAFGNFGPAGWIFPGQTWNYQTWFRDNVGPCNQKSNISNGLSATFTP